MKNRCTVINWIVLLAQPVIANIPGGGTGKRGGVTLTNNGPTATMASGIIAIVITKANVRLLANSRANHFT